VNEVKLDFEEFSTITVSDSFFIPHDPNLPLYFEYSISVVINLRPDCSNNQNISTEICVGSSRDIPFIPPSKLEIIIHPELYFESLSLANIANYVNDKGFTIMGSILVNLRIEVASFLINHV
jgi:hypothetical protein